MSFKSKLLAGAAIAGPGRRRRVRSGGLSATAATPSCGHRCVNLFSREFATSPRPPNFVLDVLPSGREGRPADHHVPVQQHRPGRGLHRSLQGTQRLRRRRARCLPAVTSTTPNDLAIEFEYSPAGVNSGLCIGVASHRHNNEGVTLQPCGVSAKTVWIVDVQNSAPAALHARTSR